MNATDLGVLWTAFAEKGPPGTGEIRTYETLVITSAGPILIALDATSKRHVLIPVSNRSDVQEDLTGSGVRIIAGQFEDRGQSVSCADVICLRPDLNELFDILIVDVLDEIAKKPNSAAHQCSIVLARWRELLASQPPAFLGKEALSGLFGELHYLRRIIIAGPPNLGFWRGPDRERHDFRSGQTALEVKTSRARQGRFCEIHGHDQLELPERGELFLSFVRVLEDESSGESVPDLIRDIQAAGIYGHELALRLQKVGYDLRDADRYEAARFVVTEDRMYRVSQEFPRIVSQSFRTGSLPPGIKALTYEIDLTGEPPVPLSDSEVQGVLSVLAGGVRGL